MVIVAESVVYGVAVYGPQITDPTVIGILVGQLMAASVVIMFLDELIQKGWGLGSGISVFIMAGVAQTILWNMFSPLPAGDGGSIGILTYLGESIYLGDLSNVFFRANQLPSIFGLFLTAAVLLILVYVQGMKVEIPIVSTKYRGFSAVYPIKLMYVSNIPVILASALTANAVFIGQMFWANFNPRNANEFLNVLGMFDPTSPSTPIGGLIYYVTPPRGLDVARHRSAARRTVRAVHDGDSPGIREAVGGAGRPLAQERRAEPARRGRADPGLPALQQARGVDAEQVHPVGHDNRLADPGALAGISDVLGVFGSGIGILLMVDILINYYNQLVKEQVEVVMPRLGALLGRK